MKIIIYILTLFIFMTSCVDLTTKERTVCDCCETVYTNVDSALICIEKNPDTTTTAENRFLLMAFVSKDLEANQKLGWDILKDQNIIRTAKKNISLLSLT